MPSTMANITARKPTLSEVRAPYMMVDRMSRPWSSVPNRKVISPPSSQNGGRTTYLRLEPATGQSTPAFDLQALADAVNKANATDQPVAPDKLSLGDIASDNGVLRIR